MDNFVMDRIKATITELTSSQLKLDVSIDAMATKLDDLLHKPHTFSSNHCWVVILRIRLEFPNHYILPLDLRLSLPVMFAANVRDKELDHTFLPHLHATIDTAKWLCFHNTNLDSLMSYFPSPILIWDLGSTFATMALSAEGQLSSMANSAIDRIKPSIAELTSSQLKLAAVVDTMATKLDDLLQRLTLCDTSPHFPSSSPVQSPTLDASMPIPPPRLALLQQNPTPLLAPLPIQAPHVLLQPPLSRHPPDTHRVPQPPHPPIRPPLIPFCQVRRQGKGQGARPHLPPYLHATIDIANWLFFCNTNIHSLTSYFPSCILIRDLGSTFVAMV
ncbi:hypothetical protein HKD37_07G019713 [Glycine soja]